MNQSTNSLEDKLKARLQEYETPPPPGMGSTILDQVNGGAGSSPWIITLSLLLGVLLIGGGSYMAGIHSSDQEVVATAMSIDAEHKMNQTNIAQASLVQPMATDVNEAITISTQSTSGQSVEISERAKAQKNLTSEVPNHHVTDVNDVSKAPSTGEELSMSATSMSQRAEPSEQHLNSRNPMLENLTGLLSDDAERLDDGQMQLHHLDNKAIDRSALLLTNDDLIMVPYAPTAVVRPEQKMKYHLYGDLGVFFLYNHLQPNKNDGLLMENFETSGSFSMDRLSYYAEIGVKRELSKKVTLRAAAVTNLFAQKYSFDIRDEASSSVETSSTDSNLLTPVFDRQTVQMDHFLISAGARVSADFKVFSNDLNRLMLGLGYHHILNPTHTFEYKGETQKIEYPHQLTASFGFRKVVWRSDRGELSLLPVLRYGLVHKASEHSALTIKPFSVGLTVGYSLK